MLYCQIMFSGLLKWVNLTFERGILNYISNLDVPTVHFKYFISFCFAEMNMDEDSSLSVGCGNGKLRQWLIDQIDSGRYPGLIWENGEKSIFRIPWKHAGKQDYNREEDAALFKVRPVPPVLSCLIRSLWHLHFKHTTAYKSPGTLKKGQI